MDMNGMCCVHGVLRLLMGCLCCLLYIFVLFVVHHGVFHEYQTSDRLSFIEQHHTPNHPSTHTGLAIQRMAWWSNETLLIITPTNHALLVPATPADHAPTQLLDPPPPPIDTPTPPLVTPRADGGVWMAWWSPGRGGGREGEQGTWRVVGWQAVAPVARVQGFMEAGAWEDALACAAQHGLDTDVVLRYIVCVWMWVLLCA